MRPINRWIQFVGAASLIAAAPVMAATAEDAERAGSTNDTGVERSADSVNENANQDDDSRMDRDRQNLDRNSPRGSDGGDYTVEEGDTLAEIAKQELGAADQWQQIARANDIDDPKQLRVGQKLKIPARDEMGSDDSDSMR